MTSFDLSLYLVLDPDLCRTHSMVETTMAAIAGGATIVQLRDKKVGTEGLIRIGRELMDAMAGTGVPLIVNDDIDAAIAIGADGLHVGQDDISARTARERLGRDKIIGLSIENEAVARKVDPSIVDYVGVGPIFATATKPDHKPAIGFDGLAQLIKIAKLPSVAIGGLKRDHVDRVFAAGADGLAVVSAICGQPDPEAAAHKIATAIMTTKSAFAP
ncbi:MAG TPA: thiamine phosphate synthase [Thalassospira lucentensis]|uniref:Thiamine-phosphate synthase n=2 Tax=Thalassospira lucentensis TaxID=168935 RepID=A0A3D5NDB6_9PROT|nr:thiamine phosphate synthase [Thalassospira lucentensis]HCW69357.1 thiamine phosphate synthase [Thalassospira lucentensis]|tara:strand:- start:632 stop:1279 length:648 start_codon:yes stop_codon:yes gene_type:complete